MTPLQPSSTTGRGYTPAAAPPSQAFTESRTGEALEQILRGNHDRTLARVRGPMVFVAQRIGLSSRRCGQIEGRIAELRQRLANPAMLSSGDGRWIDQQVFDLEKALHDERLVLWRDLLPLMETARDAAVDAMRSSWINELARVLDGGGAQ